LKKVREEEESKDERKKLGTRKEWQLSSMANSWQQKKKQEDTPLC
jgi:hypothetical protein